MRPALWPRPPLEGPPSPPPPGSSSPPPPLPPPAAAAAAARLLPAAAAAAAAAAASAAAASVVRRLLGRRVGRGAFWAGATFLSSIDDKTGESWHRQQGQVDEGREVGKQAGTREGFQVKGRSSASNQLSSRRNLQSVQLAVCVCVCDGRAALLPRYSLGTANGQAPMSSRQEANPLFFQSSFTCRQNFEANLGIL